MSVQTNSGIALDILKKELIGEALKTIKSVIQRDHDAETALTKLSQHTEINIAHFSNDRTHAEIAEYLIAASEDKDGLYAHSAYAVARRNLEEAGFNWVVEALCKEGLPLHDCGAILEAVVMRALTIQVFAVHGNTLGRFRGERLDEFTLSIGGARP